MCPFPSPPTSPFCVFSFIPLLLELLYTSMQSLYMLTHERNAIHILDIYKFLQGKRGFTLLDRRLTQRMGFCAVNREALGTQKVKQNIYPTAFWMRA